jgi:hypothetical protein
VIDFVSRDLRKNRRLLMASVNKVKFSVAPALRVSQMAIGGFEPFRVY